MMPRPSVVAGTVIGRSRVVVGFLSTFLAAVSTSVIVTSIMAGGIVTGIMADGIVSAVLGEADRRGEGNGECGDGRHRSPADGGAGYSHKKPKLPELSAPANTIP